MTGANGTWHYWHHALIIFHKIRDMSGGTTRMHNIRQQNWLWVLPLTIVMTATCTRLPESEYDWHPELKKTRGRLEKFLSQLPIGKFGSSRECHPSGPSDDRQLTHMIQNYGQYIRRVKDAKVEAFSWYRNPRHVTRSLAYSALVDPKIAIDIQKPSTIDGGIVHFPKDAELWRLKLLPRRIEHIVAKESTCSVYAINGSVSPVRRGLSGHIGANFLEYELDHVALVGAKRNLYLEIVVPAKGASVSKEDAPSANEEGESISPRKWLTDLSWDRPPLLTLRRAHDATQLNVCAFGNLE